MNNKRLTSYCLGCVTKNQLHKYPENITEEQTLAYMQRALKIISEAQLCDSAPVLVNRLDKLRMEMFGETIDYSWLKHYFNEYVMKKEEQILWDVNNAEDCLLRALQYSMTGNYIDFGAVENVTEEQFEDILKNAKDILFNESTYDALKKDLAAANSLVFLHDNCGEIVFDHILIKTIKKLNPDLNITSFVRGFPVLNDATIEDAKQIGLTQTVSVVENGSSIAGTCLDEISAEALECINHADLIISKGQGNFETLNGCGLNVYYLFMCKCKMFADRFKKNLFEGMLINDKEV